MSLGEHLEELRLRLIRCIVAVVVAAAASWTVRGWVMAALMRPHVLAMAAFDRDATLKFASYLEPVVAQVKACLIVALVVTAPVLIYQAWAFVAPGLFPHERNRVLKLFGASLVCFVAGVAFGYFLFIPIVFRYLLTLAGPATEPVLMIGKYLSTFFLLTFALGVAFQTPVVIAYLIRWKVLDVATLQRQRKIVILVAFIIAAVITPPDPLTQIMMAVTLVVLYDLGGLVAAPGWATLRSFSQFTGIIVAVLGAFLIYVNYWPVARATALRGQVQVAARTIDVGRTVRVRRGVQCVSGENSLLRIEFGSKGAAFYLAGAGSLRVHGPGKVSVQKGVALAASPRRDANLEVFAGPATLTVAGARAEVGVPDADTAIVTVFVGEVTARVEGTERQVKAGRTQTFYRGGEPADVSEAQERWRDLIGSLE